MAKTINDISNEILTEILSNLPQKDLVLCRTVCHKWRNVIDQHCPMKETIRLKEDDIFLERKLELRMTSCSLSYFQKTIPNISLLYPQTIKSFTFCDRPWRIFDKDTDELNIENARGLLLQIVPVVEHLHFDAIYFYNNNILSRLYLFPKLRQLNIMLRLTDLRDNFQMLFSHQFPLLDSLDLRLTYSNETLMTEACVSLSNFLANHRETLKMLLTYIYFSVEDFNQNRFEFDLSEKNIGNFSDGKLQLESLELIVPPIYVPLWTPIIKRQKKLTSLSVGYSRSWMEPGCYPFYVILPGILSSACTLRKVILRGISSVAVDGITWIPLDISVFRDVLNLTKLDLERSFDDTVPKPNENEGAWITNLNEINSTSLKELTIHGFVCNSKELQILIDNSPVLEGLFLVDVLAPRTSVKFAESGVHGGIAKSFVEKESKKFISLCGGSLNYEDVEQNEKFEAVRKLYPDDHGYNEIYARFFY